MTFHKDIFSKTELEDMADSINRRHFSDRLNCVSALDPYDLLEKIGCDYEWKYISPDKSILGMTFFDDGTWHIWSDGKFEKGKTTYHSEQFSKGTVVINQTVLDNMKQEEENWIVTHEAGHWIKDQYYFKLQEDTPFQICKKNDFEKTYWNQRSSKLEIIERQTNYLAAALLMPREVTRDEFFKIGRYKNIPKQPIEFKSYMRAWIAKLAKEYNLNYNPVLYRLYDIGVLER